MAFVLGGAIAALALLHQAELSTRLDQPVEWKVDHAIPGSTRLSGDCGFGCGVVVVVGAR